jgi:hypothetical protein
LEVLGLPPEESLALAQKILAQKPDDLGQVLEFVQKYRTGLAPTDYPMSSPPINRQSMITDKLSNSDFFNDFEL